MEKVRRIVILQKDLNEQIRAIMPGNIDRYQRKSRMFSKKPWRMAAPVKQRKLGKASHL
jgi:hypothetical protein